MEDQRIVLCFYDHQFPVIGTLSRRGNFISAVGVSLGIASVHIYSNTTVAVNPVSKLFGS